MMRQQMLWFCGSLIPRANFRILSFIGGSNAKAWNLQRYDHNLTMTSLGKHAIEASDSWNVQVERQEREKVEDSLGKHAIEASDSWNVQVERQERERVEEEQPVHRLLKHHRRHRHHKDELPTLSAIGQQREKEFLKDENKKKQKKKDHAKRKHEKRMKEMLANPGIGETTAHGFIIDAGSTGSRLHVYEWEPRVLFDSEDVQDVVSGKRLTFPGTDSRWTDKLRPGLATFASLSDDKLERGIADYLSPLMEFAETVLREKSKHFQTYPIFLRATAGMRTLDTNDRARVLGAVRSVFSNKTLCPFYFEDEYARVLSGEEEAIFGWAGINFAMGSLVAESIGAGTVINPSLTYGALDMGGASTQISFYEPTEDIMSNLFKLQIGQGKHWNLYAHSFLFYGINEARERLQSRLLAGTSAQDRLVDGVFNPCLPGGSRKDVRLKVHINNDGEETWKFDAHETENGAYNAVLKNENKSGNFEECMIFTNQLLHLEKNTWCDFAHKGDCSFAGIYQPELPRQSEHFGEFLAFSNYYVVWDFLGLPERASIAQLKNATEHVCSMSKDEIFEFNRRTGKVDDDDVEDFCFRSAYAYQLLRNGYGFKPDEHIIATNVLKGQKVSWALGAMLYEINTLPWKYVEPVEDNSLDFTSSTKWSSFDSIFMGMMVVGIVVSVVFMFTARKRRARHYYEPIKEAHAADVLAPKDLRFSDARLSTIKL
jgi:Golgi nucleoside diphosphatase